MSNAVFYFQHFLVNFFFWSWKKGHYSIKLFMERNLFSLNYMKTTKKTRRETLLQININLYLSASKNIYKF